MLFSFRMKKATNLEDLLKRGSQKSCVKRSALELMRARILLKAHQA